MAIDMFLKLGDIKGESQDKTHKEEIEVLAWSWGLHQSGTMHMGTGGGAGKVSVRDLSFTKYADKASPTIVAACTKGSHIDKATLTVRKASGDKPLEYYTVMLEGVLVSSFSTGGSGGDERFFEEVTLNFEKFHIKYQPQDWKGQKDGGEVEVAWNIPKNATS